MVFGVFDVLHDGHRYFLQEARKLGDKLVIVVAPDASVQTLKKFLPSQPLSERMKNLVLEALADEVVAGDDTIGSWAIITRYRPGIVALGYDQDTLGETLKKFIAQNKLNITCVSVLPFVDKSIHSSNLRKK